MFKKKSEIVPVTWGDFLKDQLHELPSNIGWGLLFLIAAIFVSYIVKASMMLM